MLKKLVSEKDALSLLEGLGDSETISQDLEKNIKTFVQLIYNSGVKDESDVDTRVRMYQKMKVKSSMGLLADHEFLKQHIQRANFQLLEGLQCDKEYMPDKNS